jgi:hypothetical protein
MMFSEQQVSQRCMRLQHRLRNVTAQQQLTRVKQHASDKRTAGVQIRATWIVTLQIHQQHSRSPTPAQQHAYLFLYSSNAKEDVQHYHCLKGAAALRLQHLQACVETWG